MKSSYGISLAVSLPHKFVGHVALFPAFFYSSEYVLYVTLNRVVCLPIFASLSQENKGIYVRKTPAEGAVERAHLMHTLAHGLAHRPGLQELSHKGVYLEVRSAPSF